MIMSDRDLRASIASGYLGVDPLTDVQIQPASIDLRLGGGVVRFKPSFGAVLANEGMKPDEVETETIPEGSYVWVRPGEFILGHTLETVRFPDDLCGRVEGRSSIGRLGLTMHVTAGFIDPGFHGQITLEIANLSRRAVCVPVGHRVCQLVVHTMLNRCLRPYGQSELGSKFSGEQRGAVPFLGKSR